MLGSSPKKGFLKSIVSPRKRSLDTDATPRTPYSATPQLPPLDFRTHVDASQQASKQLQEVIAAPPKPPAVKHKKSNSNISVRNLFGDKSSKHAKQNSKDKNLEGQQPAKSKSATDFGILKQLHRGNRSPKRKPSLKKPKKQPEYQEDVNKENESPYCSIVPIDPLVLPIACTPQGRPNLQKPLPRLRTASNVSANPEDEIKLYTPREYSASGQRNFFDYEVTLKPRPQSVAIGDRKSSWSSMISFSSNSLQRKGTNASSIDSQKRDRQNSLTGSSASAVGNKSSTSPLRKSPTIPEPKPVISANSSDADIEAAFEALLDARAIPENMRGKLRKLDPKVKADFIKQDREEAAAAAKKQANKSDKNLEATLSSTKRSASPQKRRPLSGFIKGTSNEAVEDGPRKKSIDMPRPKSRGFNILNKESATISLKNIASPKKKAVDEKRPTSAHSNKGLRINTSVAGSSINLQSQTPTTPTGDVSGKHPEEFIKYLKSATAQTAELGWLHKLRLILRNERLAWVEDFVRTGGFGELEKLLYSILDIEWREEREDSLLHEILLCFKALCTSPAALEKLDESHQILFSRIINLLFDPEKKGPSEFTTRGLIIGLLFTHISASTVEQRQSRAKSVLKILSDPTPRASKRPVEFVDQMHTSRPYKRWCKEVVDVTKEVFWIFLHHQNIVPFITVEENVEFAVAYRPRERVPVPAAPYVGGVEWDATNYLATHMDLINALMCSVPTTEERNNLRRDMRNSGFEKAMGGSLRTASTKFYGAVHEGLKVWVAAAVCDAWDGVSAVRCGNFTETAPPKSKKKAKAANAPKVELPALAFDFEMKSRDGGAIDKESALKVDKNGEVDLSWQF